MGARGQVGWELSRSLVVYGNVNAVSRAQCDFSDEVAVDDLLSASRASVIVNAAAYTAVDRAESDANAAYALNAALPERLARYAKERNAWLLHFSTDYVFDGSKTDAYVETDAGNPQGVYGKSKLAGEQAVLAESPLACVFRLSWVFGRHGNNFVKTILRLAREREQLTIVADQHGCPTPAALAADVAACALRDHLNGKTLSGVHHLSGSGPTSWHAYAQTIIVAARALGKAGLRVGPEQVAAISTAQFATAAKRPANSVLDCGKLERALNITLPDWRPYLYQIIEEIA